jgi:hypothetical protein
MTTFIAATRNGGFVPGAAGRRHCGRCRLNERRSLHLWSTSGSDEIRRSRRKKRTIRKAPQSRSIDQLFNDPESGRSFPTPMRPFFDAVGLVFLETAAPK